MAIDAATLKKFPLFAVLDDGCLARLAAEMALRSLAAGDVIFNEDDVSDSVYFIVSGAVRIEKRLDDGQKSFKTLALLGEGAFFGEMAALSAGAPAPRSARAAAEGAATLAEISGRRLFSILEASPQSGMAFVRHMLASVAERLRKTSSELAMVCDIGALAFAEFETEKQFAARLLDEAMPHFDKGWSAGFYVYDYFNEELELAAVKGAAFAEPQGLRGIAENRPNFWQDDFTYVVVLAGENRPDGFIVFVSARQVSPEDRRALAVALSTLGFFSNAIVDNIRHIRENTLRERLMKRRAQ